MKNYLQTRSNSDDIFDAFSDFFRPMFYEESTGGMRTDIREKEGNYELDIELPGFDKSEIKISLQNGYLTVGAEKKEKDPKEGKYLRRECILSCRRSYYVGEDIPQDGIKAKYEQGVLSLTIPKESPKKIEEKTINIE